MEPLRLLLQNAQTWFGQLTTREKRLVSAAAAAVGVFVLFVMIFSFGSTARSIQRRTEDKLAKLQEVQTLAASFRESELSRQAVERELAQSNVQLVSFLEEKSGTAGLEIRSMNPKPSQNIGGDSIVESSVEITLTDIAIDKLVRFLESLERGPGVVKVKFLRMEPRAENQTLTAHVTVATYKLKGSP